MSRAEQREKTRRVLLGEEETGWEEKPDALDGATIAEALRVPKRIYARAVTTLLAACGDAVHAICHVTGGGITENLPRVLGDGLGARVDLGTFERPAIFDLIKRRGPVEEKEMRRTFNLGVGLLLAVRPADVAAAIGALTEAGEKAWRIGEVFEGAGVDFG